MNIALFSDSYLPTKSGIVTVVIQLRKVLEALGHHVIVVTVASHDPSYQGEDDPLVLRVRSVTSPLGDGQYIGLPARRKVAEFVAAHGTQIIHSHTEFSMGHSAIVTGRKLGIPVVASTHTMWEDYYRYYLALGRIIPRGAIRRAVRAVYRDFYAFVNVSQKAHDYFTAPFMLPGVPSAIIPNAIDAQKFSAASVTEADKAALRARLGITESHRVIICVGRVVEEKRVEELLAVIMRVVRARDSARMIFVGAGGVQPELAARVEKERLSGRILFPGFVDWFKLPSYYAISHVFVTASLSEMHSMTVLEAMNLSLPVVCRRDTSFADTVFHGEDGYLADTDEQMDGYLCDLIDDAEKCAAMGRRAHEVSKNFSLELHGKRTVAFYEEVLRHFPEPVTSEALARSVKIH